MGPFLVDRGPRNRGRREEGRGKAGSVKRAKIEDFTRAKVDKCCKKYVIIWDFTGVDTLGACVKVKFLEPLRRLLAFGFLAI